MAVWRVVLRDKNGETFVLDFHAEDYSHAIEQAEDFDPEATIFNCYMI